VFPSNNIEWYYLRLHRFHRNAIACGSKYCHRMLSPELLYMWSPELPWHVVPRIAIHVVPRTAMVCCPKNWQPYMVPTNDIAFGSQNCHRMWSEELPSHVVPQNCHYMWSHNCHLYVVPQLPSVFGPSVSVDSCCSKLKLCKIAY
jgi:hypothetical protein